MTLDDIRLTAVLRPGASPGDVLTRLLKLLGLYSLLALSGSAVMIAGKTLSYLPSIALFIVAMSLISYIVLSMIPAGRLNLFKSTSGRFVSSTSIAALALAIWVSPAYLVGYAEYAEQSDLHGLDPNEISEWISAKQAERQFVQSLPYGNAISQVADRRHVDGLLVAAIVQVESDFSPGAVSPRGAVGLMQVLPSVGRAYGIRDTDLLNPAVNLDTGTRYLSSLITNYNGDLRLAVAAYASTPGAVDRYGDVPPYRETREYVWRVLSLYQARKKAHQTRELPSF